MSFNTFKVKVLMILSAMLVSALMVGIINAQTGTSGFRGTVKDQTGAIIPGATVKLTNVGTGNTRTATTTDDGTYNFVGVPPGTYNIEVTSANFKTSIVRDAVALVDNPITLDIALEPGEVTAIVDVTSNTIESIVNVQDGSLGNNFVSEQIQELPLEGRNVSDLLSLQPGVSPDGSVTGSRSDQSNITLDGVDVNDQQNGTAFSPVLRITPDSVDEFRVTTTNADSAKGRSSGAQISLSTKSGTNEFRGALYEYHRNTITSANDFFNNSADPFVPRPKLIRNLFGGRIGGPIVKDRFFFFYNYEALREARETPVNRIVPLASLGQGSVRFFDNGGNIVTLTAAQINALTTSGQPGGTPIVDVNPAALNVLADAAARYPANNFRVGDGLNTGGYLFNASVPAANNTHTGRLDWNVTSDNKHAVSFRGIFQDDFFDGVQQFPDTAATRRISRPFGIVASHTWIISNNLINNFRYGFTRQSFEDTGDTTNDSISFRDVFSPVTFSYPFSRKTDTQNFVNDVSWVKGNHNIQFGGNIRVVRNNREDEAPTYDTAVVNRSFYAGSGNVLTNPILATGNPNSPGNNYTIASSSILSTRDAVAAVLGRFPDYSFNSNFAIDGSLLPDGQPIVRNFATEEYDVYLQDAWRIRQNLTLTFGLRYGLSRPVYETQGYQAKPNVGLDEYLQRRIAASNTGQNYGDEDSEALIIDLAGPANGKGDYYPWDKNNFQPNVSVAWSPNFKSGFWRTLFGADSASVIRGGFRITNDYFGQSLAVNFDANNTLGFASNLGISANTYNVSTNPGPLFTGFDQTVRNLPLPPGGSLPTSINFP